MEALLHIEQQQDQVVWEEWVEWVDYPEHQCLHQDPVAHQAEAEAHLVDQEAEVVEDPMVADPEAEVVVEVVVEVHHLLLKQLPLVEVVDCQE